MAGERRARYSHMIGRDVAALPELPDVPENSLLSERTRKPALLKNASENWRKCEDHMVRLSPIT